MTQKYVFLFSLISGLFLFSCQNAPVKNTRQISSQEISAADEAALKNLKENLAQLQKDWDADLTKGADGSSFYSPETNAKYLPQVTQIVRQIFSIENVKYNEPTVGLFNISYSPEDKDASKLNHLAWSYYTHMDQVQIAYDPMDLYLQNYGGGYDPDKNRISLSNQSMCTDIAATKFGTWLTGNEVHESVHAKVDDLQNSNVWHPLWGELGSLDATKPFRHPYDHSIYFDELMAYHKQMMYLVGKGFADSVSSEERFKQINKYFPILKNLVVSILTTLPKFKGPIVGNYQLISSANEVDPHSKLYQIDIHTDRIGQHIVIHKEGYHLDLILKMQDYPQVDDKVKFAQWHIEQVRQLVSKLNSTYARFPIAIKPINVGPFRDALNSVRDLIAFPKE